MGPRSRLASLGNSRSTACTDSKLKISFYVLIFSAGIPTDCATYKKRISKIWEIFTPALWRMCVDCLVSTQYYIDGRSVCVIVSRMTWNYVLRINVLLGLCLALAHCQNEQAQQTPSSAASTSTQAPQPQTAGDEGKFDTAENTYFSPIPSLLGLGEDEAYPSILKWSITGPTDPLKLPLDLWLKFVNDCGKNFVFKWVPSKPTTLSCDCFKGLLNLSPSIGQQHHSFALFIHMHMKMHLGSVCWLDHFRTRG